MTFKAPPRQRRDRCEVESCDGRVHGNGLCIKHYTRVRRYGSATDVPIVRGDDMARLLHNVKITDAGCWEWKKALNKGGYGTTVFRGVHCGTHKMSWILHKGEVPSGMQVNHNCHNRKCANPNHLYVGTQAQNMRDMIAAGRSRLNRPRGERSKQAKLKEESVRSILQSAATTAALARQWNVSESLIRAIRQRKVWRHVA